jgi:Lrp/AsnC family leucine-responsive transcriptional regulator
VCELDEIDLRILAALQTDNQRTAEELGERVGLSTSAVQRRIKRLRQEGVILRDTSVIDPKAVGMTANFIVEVSLERENSDVIENFKRRMRQIPQVQQCYYTTGDADFILFILSRSLDAYNDVIQPLFIDDRTIRRFKTSVVLQTVKAGLTVPLTED